jgi:hypothetical protein
MTSSESAQPALLASGEWRELASRENDGLAVTLLWSKATTKVKVAVDDARLDEAFELKVESAEALAAFYHPFAYAACQRLSVGTIVRESRDLQPQS